MRFCKQHTMDELMDDDLPTPENFDFPFPPYSIQNDFMKNLFYVIQMRKLGIFESPTGTGKSLSIICGAIRWLKDHNKFIRDKINQAVKKLEKEKESISTSGSDWLSTQAKELDLIRKLNTLKIEQKKMVDYDDKIEKIIQNKEKKNIRLTGKFSKNNKEEPDLLKEEKIKDDDDIVLEDISIPNEENFSDEESEDDKYHPVKIYICSRTHSQLTQFVGEIIKSPFGKNVRVATLASRQNYCINPSVSGLKNMGLINERCLDMQKQTTKATKTDEHGRPTKKKKGQNCKCPFYKQTAIDDLKDWALSEIQDVEDLISSGKEIGACPYYASRKAAEDAEVVLIPYNTLLHKATREANGINLRNNIIIIDEAHNLLEAMAQMYNAELNLNQLKHAAHQLKCYKQRFNTRFSAKNLLSINQLSFVVTKLLQMLKKDIDDLKVTKTEIFTIQKFTVTAMIDNYNMFNIINFCKDSRIGQKIRSYSLKYPLEEEMKAKPVKKGVSDFLSSIKNQNNIIEEPKQPEEIKKPESPPPSNPLLAVISFLETLTYSTEDGRVMMTKCHEKLQSKFQFLLLNPSSNFCDIVKEARSVIVAGGTMKPNSEFRDRLFIGAGGDPNRIVEFSCDHIIPPENILPMIITKGPKGENLLFNYENRFNMGENLKNIIIEACKKIKGGIVVFFPSYKYETWFWQLIKDVNFGRSVFREPQTSGAVDSVLQKYADAIKRPSSSGALLLSVVGGKLSEGLNFSDDLGRCVMVVGLPYANIMAVDLKEKMAYLDKTEGFGAGQKFYENLCMKAVNQCIGRAVRHKDDYAIVFLLDERYNRVSTKNALPGWIKRSLKVCQYDEAFKSTEEFFRSKKAK